MIELDLKNRVALISGGSRGLGRELALCFAREGASVAFTFREAEDAASETVSLVEGYGVDVLAVKSDVSVLRDAASAVERAYARFGRIDFLVCNAGIWEGAEIERMDEATWDRSLQVNLKGSWTLTKASVPKMKDARFGRIVYISSTAGQRGEPFYANYAASKAGQIALTKSLAVELAPFNINVNAVAPGWMETDMTSGVMGDVKERQRIEQGIPLKRVAQPEDVALPILFLCSSWARHITGEVLNVNGGAVLCG